MDYCNSLISDCPLYLLSRLQKVKNFAVKLLFKAYKHDHMQLLLLAFHGLLVQARTDDKLSISVTTSSPTHLLRVSLTSLCTPGSFILLQTHKYFVSPMLEQKPLANAVSPTALPSDICHIQSSHPFKIAWKIHLYKQYHNKWFQILSSCLPPPPSCLIIFSLFLPMHACICIHACVHCVCVCVCMSGCDVWGTYTILWQDNYHFWGFNVHIFCWSYKMQCAHPCQWDMVLYKWPLLLLLKVWGGIAAVCTHIHAHTHTLNLSQNAHSAYSSSRQMCNFQLRNMLCCAICYEKILPSLSLLDWSLSHVLFSAFWSRWDPSRSSHVWL